VVTACNSFQKPAHGSLGLVELAGEEMVDAFNPV
jgi:hypothetical protein